MYSRFRLHLARTVAFSAAVLICGSALGAPKDDAAKADCAQKALIQYNLDNAACALYPLTSVLYGECMARSARNYGNALVACAQAEPSQTYRPQLSRPGRPTIKQ